jgi:hypothetical protein
VKLVEDAVAVQEAASRARASVTVTVPSDPEIVEPGAPEPMLAAAGAVIVSPPTVTVKVMVVFGSPPALPCAAAAAEACDTALVLANAAPGASVTPMSVPAASAPVSDLRMVVLPRGPDVIQAVREVV